jgi:hypothetical protein
VEVWCLLILKPIISRYGLTASYGIVEFEGEMNTIYEDELNLRGKGEHGTSLAGRLPISNEQPPWLSVKLWPVSPGRCPRSSDEPRITR